jgi:hypothetical protein
VIRARDLPPNRPVIQIAGLFAARVRTATKDRGWRRLSWRARFIAATRTKLASVPDHRARDLSPFCRIADVASSHIYAMAWMPSAVAAIADSAGLMAGSAWDQLRADHGA